MSEIINVVTQKNGKIKKQKIKASPYEFTIATRGKWEMIVADEDVIIEEGKLLRMKVKEIKVQKDMIAMPCALNHHPLASVIKVAARNGAAPMETERIIVTAYVIGHESGEIQKGDLLSILNIYPIMFTRDATIPEVIW